MISAETERKLAALYEAQDDYRPQEAASSRLSEKTMLMLVGATCMGKNTIMRAVAESDRRFKIVGTFTSRDPRPNDDPDLYTYYENTDEGLRPLLERIDRHEVVQYAVNMHAKLIYGSEITDYSGLYNLADVFSSAVSNIRKLGFKRALAFTVVADPANWLARFEERFPLGHPQRSARRDEAIESLIWSLKQSAGEHFWIENIEDQAGVTAKKLIRITEGASAGSEEAPAAAGACLTAARAIII